VTEERRASELIAKHRDAAHRTARLIALGEFASAVAHELNQPLAAIAVEKRAAADLLHVHRVRQRLDQSRQQRHTGLVDGKHENELTRVCPSCCRASRCLASPSKVADPNNKLSRALEGFELLLAAATALVRARSARPALFDAYDDASDRLMDGLRGNGIREQELQAVHKALSRLRLALEENSP